MEWNRALAKYLKKHGDELSVKEVIFYRKALKWWGFDISDDNYEEDILNIVNNYVYCIEHDLVR